jgi:hypothetical protein
VERLVMRRLVLLGTPLALAVLEIFHPKPSGVAEAVEQGGWFMWFHIIQVPLIGRSRRVARRQGSGAGVRLVGSGGQSIRGNGTSEDDPRPTPPARFSCHLLRLEERLRLAAFAS